MGAEWVTHPSWEVVDTISQATNTNVANLLCDTDQDTLTQTNNAQLATFTMSMVALDALLRVGLQPTLVAGHSLGEYSALVAAGVIGLDDGARLVLARGNAMRDAAAQQQGTMWAVLGLGDDLVETACREVGGDVWVANYNAPGQVIIAGTPEALEAAGARAKQLGAKRAVAISVGGAFHTPLMEPAREMLADALAQTRFAASDIDVVTNVDAALHAAGSTTDWQALLNAQLCSPVRWHDSAVVMAAAGTSLLVEVGPGNVLCGLAKRSIPGVTAISAATPADLERIIDDVTHNRLAQTNSASPSVAATQASTRVANHSIDKDPSVTSQVPAPSNNTTARIETAPHCEPLFMTERLIVSPAAGVFDPQTLAVDLQHATEVEVGSVLGTVAGTEVRSPFRGQLMGMLAMPGERVTVGQPIAWLRTASL
jgi:[acyl-carrier-protein] S-malonyltransferase